MKMNSFQLFEQDFKEGDQVVIVNDLDLIDWGVLTYNDKGFALASGRRPARHYTWDQCVMMAHDGFPVRKIFGRFPKGQDITDKQIFFRAGFAVEVIEKLEREINEIKNIVKQHIGSNPHINKSIRDMYNTIHLLEKEREPMNSYWTEDERETVISSEEDVYDAESTNKKEDIRIASIRFGCPFETGIVTLQLYNPGGCGRMYDLTSQEETLRMIADNGCVGQLWQLDSVFDIGV